MQKITLLLAATLIVVGCAKRSTEIPSSYVPSVAYENYNCKQLQAEAVRISRRTAELRYQVDDKAEGDEAATAIGLILFWPALFFIDGTGPESYEYGRMKGEMDAIEVASIQKECGFKIERPPVPEKPKTQESPTGN